MERSPIYQTRSTRVLHYHRSHRVIVKYALAGVVLVVLGALLGHGLPVTRRAVPPVPSVSAVTTMHQAVIDQLVTTPTIVPADRRPQTVLGASGSSPALRPSAMPSGVSSSVPVAQWQVANTGGLGLCLRPDHDGKSRPIKVLPEGTLLTAIDPDIVVAEHSWRHVSAGVGMTGWVASEYLIHRQ